MASTGSPKSLPCSFLNKLGLLPPAENGKLSAAVSICGGTSYGLLAVNMFNPELIAKYWWLSCITFVPTFILHSIVPSPRISPNRDLTNVLLGGTLIGGCLYLYNKPHISSLEDQHARVILRYILSQFPTASHLKRIYFPVGSVYGSTMVGLGSLLLWAMVKAVMPENPALRTALAVGSSVVLLRIGTTYVEVIEGLANSSAK